MLRPWTVIDDEELKQLRNQSSLLKRAILAGARWTGKCSPEWDLLVEIAKESQIHGLVEQLAAIKKASDEWHDLHAGDPWSW